MVPPCPRLNLRSWNSELFSSQPSRMCQAPWSSESASHVLHCTWPWQKNKSLLYPAEGAENQSKSKGYFVFLISDCKPLEMQRGLSTCNSSSKQIPAFIPPLALRNWSSLAGRMFAWVHSCRNRSSFIHPVINKLQNWKLLQLQLRFQIQLLCSQICSSPLM